MRSTIPTEEKARLAFAEKAAAAFKESPDLTSFSEGDITPGCLLALRWGYDNDCVLVLKLDEAEEPVLFQQMMPRPETNEDRLRKRIEEMRNLLMGLKKEMEYRSQQKGATHLEMSAATANYALTSILYILGVSNER